MEGMAEEKYLDLIAKYLSGNITSDERGLLFEWIALSEANQRYFDEMIQLWSIQVDVDEHEDLDIDAAWSNLDQRIEDTISFIEDPAPKIVSIQKRKKLSSRFILQIAATIILLLTGGYFISNQFTDQPGSPIISYIATEKTETVLLPDGSKIWLNKGSELSFDSTFDIRTVELSGEGYFEITSDPTKPFTIITEDAHTTVLGTAFNLRAYPEEEAIELVVKEGKVKFESVTNQESVILTQNKSAAFIKENASIEEKKITSENIFAWKTGTIRFNNTPMEVVVYDLSRQFKADFKIANGEVANCIIKGTYGPDESLDDILEDIEEVTGITSNKVGETYIVSGTCQQN